MWTRRYSLKSHSEDVSEAGLNPGGWVPRLSPALTLDSKRCCGDGEDRMKNRPAWGAWS